MKKQIMAVIVCATVILGGCGTKKEVASTTTEAQETTQTEASVEETTEAESTEEETEGTQEIAEIAQPTLSEQAKKAVEESIAAMETAQDEEQVNGGLSDSARTFTLDGKSFVLNKTTLDEFYEMFPRTVPESDIIMIFQREDDISAYDEVGLEVNKPNTLNVLWSVEIGALFSTRSIYTEPTDVFMEWNGHCIGDVLSEEQLLNEGFEHYSTVSGTGDINYSRFINEDVLEIITLVNGVVMQDKLSYEGSVTTAQ